MRKPLLLAAALTSAMAVTVGSSPAKADGFNITASSPGSLSFTGSGTAQFNNSLGTNNSFQVGSATSLGVNASASSTKEYGVASTADLQLSGASVLNQVIGTSGAGQSKTATSTRAHDVTRNAMSGRSWERDWESGREYTDRNGNTSTYDGQASYEAAYNAEYNAEYQNAYSQIKSTESSSTSDGTISGSFKTIENSRAGTAGSEADVEAATETAVAAEYGADYSSRGANFTSMTEMEYATARQLAYEKEYASQSATNSRFSDSQVTVKGIGSDASVVSKDTSSFKTEITANSGVTAGSTATAQGGAGASLSTVSLANQSQSQTASAFIQSFGGTGSTASVNTDSGVVVEGGGG